MHGRDETAGRDVRRELPRVGESVANELPRRVLSFLRTAGANAEVRFALAEVGYRKEHHDEGIRLLAAAIAYGATDEEVDALLATPRVDPRAAEASLHEFARSHIARLRAAVRRVSPDEERRIFDGLLPCPRVKAIVHVGVFIARLDATTDARVIDALAARGCGREERARLAKLADEARTPASPSIETEAFHRLRRAQLAALHAWWHEWSAAARSVVVRRDYRAHLGIGDLDG